MTRWMFRLALLAGLAFAFGGCPATGDDDDNDDAGDDDTTAEPQPYGPENSWWHALADDVPADLALGDQFGDEVELYQFYGQVIVIDLFAYW